jgi:RNA-directed DNA polymerase
MRSLDGSASLPPVVADLPPPGSRYDWVLDLDARAFFDTLDHRLVMHAVRKYTSCRCVLLYIERWLKAPTQVQDGSLVERTSGSPQGGVISPLLANIFLHRAFDT